MKHSSFIACFIAAFVCFTPIAKAARASDQTTNLVMDFLSNHKGIRVAAVSKMWDGGSTVVNLGDDSNGMVAVLLHSRLHLAESPIWVVPYDLKNRVPVQGVSKEVDMKLRAALLSALTKTLTAPGADAGLTSDQQANTKQLLAWLRAGPNSDFRPRAWRRASSANH